MSQLGTPPSIASGDSRAALVFAGASDLLSSHDVLGNAANSRLAQFQNTKYCIYDDDDIHVRPSYYVQHSSCL